jgi:hypothetical protein
MLRILAISLIRGKRFCSVLNFEHSNFDIVSDFDIRIFTPSGIDKIKDRTYETVHLQFQVVTLLSKPFMA